MSRATPCRVRARDALRWKARAARNPLTSPSALLSTLVSGAAHSYGAAHRPVADAVAVAAVHGYPTALAWSAGIFAAGAVASGLLLPSGAPELEPDARAELGFAH